MQTKIGFKSNLRCTASDFKESEMKYTDDKERNGIFECDKNIVPRQVKLIIRQLDALQRSSVLATRKELQDKSTVAQEWSRLSWTNAKHEIFIKYDTSPESISQTGVFKSNFSRN